MANALDHSLRGRNRYPPQTSINLDSLDWKILKLLHADCRISLDKLAAKLQASRSTVHYRIRRLESEGVIRGYRAHIDSTKLGKDYYTCTWIRAKYGPKYYKRVGEKLVQIAGVCGIYFVLGTQDLLVFARSNNREDFLQKLDQIASIPGVERTETQVIALVLKEDFDAP